MERCDADAAAASLVEAELDEIFCEALAAMGGVDPHIEEVTPVVVGGVEGVGRPFEQKKAG